MFPCETRKLLSFSWTCLYLCKIYERSGLIIVLLAFFPSLDVAFKINLVCVFRIKIFHIVTYCKQTCDTKISRPYILLTSECYWEDSWKNNCDAIAPMTNLVSAKYRQQNPISAFLFISPGQLWFSLVECIQYANCMKWLLDMTCPRLRLRVNLECPRNES